MEKTGDFERTALKLAALNLAFESARSGSPDEEVLRVSEESTGMFRFREETETPDSF